ncbi:hypothetical protein MBANPS3_011148 [Mucor bainieri]
MNNSPTFKLKDGSKSSSHRYFSENPISKWSFPEFMEWYNKDKSDPAQEKKIRSTYLSILDSIESSKHVPAYVKEECRLLISMASTPETTSASVNMNITAHGSSVVNALGSASQQQQQQQRQEEEGYTNAVSGAAAGPSSAPASSSHAQERVPLGLSRSPSLDGSDDHDYQSRESTPSSTSSNDDDTETRTFYLVHDGDSYEYKLKDDASRWIVNSYDVSDKYEELSLDGIFLIDNDFEQTDMIDYQHIEDVLDDIDSCACFEQPTMSPTKMLFLSTFADGMAKRRINKDKILGDIDSYKHSNESGASTLCSALTNLVNTYTASYSNATANEATLVRDSIDNILKPYFPNNTLTRSIGADSMMRDSSDRFTRLDPSLACSGKRA